MTVVNSDTTEVLRSDELTEGQLKKIIRPGREPLVACRWQGTVFVLEDMCSHGMASLSEGELIDGALVCPFHGGKFDVKTGNAVEWPCQIPIKSYEVDEANGVIRVRGW